MCVLLKRSILLKMMWFDKFFPQKTRAYYNKSHCLTKVESMQCKTFKSCGYNGLIITLVSVNRLISNIQTNIDFGPTFGIQGHFCMFMNGL